MRGVAEDLEGADEEDDLLGSQLAPEADEPEEPEADFVEYVDFAVGKAMRLHPSGAVEPCVSMKAGSDGFMVAVWKDMSETQTELPVLSVEVMRRPASSLCKKPACKRPASWAAIASDEEEEVEPPTKEDSDLDPEVARKPATKETMKNVAGTPVETTEKKRKTNKQFCLVRELPKNRDRLRPHGCSRCRWIRGCTPSCWYRRKNW